MSSEDPDVIAVVNELIDTVSGSLEGQDSSIDVSNFVEMTESDLTTEKCDILENEIEPHEKMIKKKTRSVSHNESEIESQTKNIRRKFGSEGEIFSIRQKATPQEKQKELNEAIDKYMEKLIRDSICKALENVNVDNVREELMSNIFNRKHSQSGESEEEFIVEQRLTSKSISEFVELENTGDKNIGKTDAHRQSSASESDGKVSETESVDNEVDEVDHVSFGGYLADLDETASVDDLKSIEEDSLNSSSFSGFGTTIIPPVNNDENSEICCQTVTEIEPSEMTGLCKPNSSIEEITAVPNDEKLEQKEDFSTNNGMKKTNNVENTTDSKEDLQFDERTDDMRDNLDISLEKNLSKEEQNNLSTKIISQQDQKQSTAEAAEDSTKDLPIEENIDEQQKKIDLTENIDKNGDLILISPEDEALLLKYESKSEDNKSMADLGEGLPQQNVDDDQRMKINWKVGCLHVKLPHKTRGKTHLKAWKKRRVIIQPDEFVNDPKNPSLVISVYSSDCKKHETIFWYSVSSLKAVVFRCSSHSHRYAFTISEGGQALIHLSAENESATQEWMAAIRAVLWPPSSFMELEKVLSGREFDVSIVDNEFSYHAGLLGMYGFLSITPKKLILLHPQEGYVIQEWYLNTVDNFKFVPQPKSEDEYKVLCMTTCSDSSTGRGEIIFFCNDSVTLLQSLASSIHEVLSYHSNQEGGRYKKELEEIAEWLVAPPQDCLNVEDSEHYKVPPRQVKSLLDIPNFIFNKSLSPVSSAIYPAPNTEIMDPLDTTRNKQITTSHDSGISNCTSSEDILNCSIASFIIGGGPMTGKSSDSEMSDAYTPPRTPELKKKKPLYEVVKEEISATDE